jgi:hypothetical protein
LEVLKIKVPEQLWHELMIDRHANIGNAKIRWSRDGTKKPEQ